jgi:hypothetical protein
VFAVRKFSREDAQKSLKTLKSPPGDGKVLSARRIGVHSRARRFDAVEASEYVSELHERVAITGELKENA